MENFYPFLIMGIGFLVALGMTRLKARLSARTNALLHTAVAVGIIAYAILAATNVYPFLIGLIIGYPAMRRYYAEWRVQRAGQ